MAHTETTLLSLVRLVRARLSTKTRRLLVVVAFALILRSAWIKTRGPERLLKSFEDKLEEEYDVIVVGGGTAGCAIASRLSENRRIRVLLLEAGQSSKTNLLSRIPSAFASLFHTEHDYNLYTVPQSYANKRVWYWPRAKMLGGCSGINAMMYHYGAPTDYDQWAQIVGDRSWAYKNFIRYFRKFEKYSPSKKYPLVDAKHRSSQGLVSVGYNAYTGSLTKAFLEACQACGIPTSPDVNTSKGTLGTTRIMSYVNSSGERVTTESAYLTPNVLRRPNLTVVTGARATKLVFSSAAGGKLPKVTGVEFTQNKDGSRLVARAKREVVLSAGTVHTPQLLMLSGIGPADHLSSHGIPVYADLPGVGSGLKDHITVNTFFRDMSGQSLSFLSPSNWWEKLRLQMAKIRWLTTGGGPLSTNLGEGAAFARVTDDNLFKGEKVDDVVPIDTTSGPQAPDVEYIYVNAGYSRHGDGSLPGGNIITLFTVLLRPESEGTIRLASTDIFDPPVIDPQYLSSKNDVATLVRGLRLGLRVVHAPPFDTVLDPSENSADLDHFLHLESNEALAEAIRDRAETLYHPCRTARMAPREEGGVVDERLRVYGVRGLRVADASVFPEIVAGHTSAPCIAIGEKCADMVKEDIASLV